MSLNEETKGGTHRVALAFVMAERKAAEWNARWPAGTPCILETYLGGPRVNTATCSEAWALPSGQASVMVEGRTGSYGLDWLTPGKQLPEVTP